MEMADKVIAERGVLHYRSFDDLQKRVSGLGATKIQMLKNADFVVNFTEKPASSFGAAEEEESSSNGNPWRMNVSSMREQTWTRRKSVDLYTCRKRKGVERPEVGHIIECQLIFAAAVNAHDYLPHVTRQHHAFEQSRELFNSTINLNVTTNHVNQNKKFPFKEWLHVNQYSHRESLEDIVRRTKSGRKLTDEGVWGNIGRSMVMVYDELAENARGMQNGHTPAIVKQLNMIMTRMEIM
jgi:hypothetical protein